MIDFLVAVCIALIAMALIEWLKKPFPKAPTWLWWALAPIFCVALGILWEGLTVVGVFIGLVGFALATLCYDTLIKWVKAKIEAL